MARRDPPSAKSGTLRLNKIDVAEAHIVSAVKLFFENGHPVSVYLLASAVREILTTLGDKMGVETLLHVMSEWKGEPLKETIKKAHGFARFFKHADMDPTAFLEFPEDEVDGILFIACHDFGRITRGMPVHAQVYEAFFLAQSYKHVSKLPLRNQRLVRNIIKAFPGVRSADRCEKKRIGLAVLEKALVDPALRMEINRDIKLALEAVQP
jgi:hypothetical protein